MKLHAVALEWVPAVWPQAAVFLAPAIEHSRGDYSIAHAQALVAAGLWQLVVATDEEGTVRGAATLNYFNRPTARVAFVTALGGRGVVNRVVLEQLKVLAAQNGATCIEVAARESVARLLGRCGFKDKYTMLGVQL